jgi:hypothetical protein
LREEEYGKLYGEDMHLKLYNKIAKFLDIPLLPVKPRREEESKEESDDTYLSSDERNKELNKKLTKIARLKAQVKARIHK